MKSNVVLSLIICVLFLTRVDSYNSVSPTWVTNNYFRAENNKVINSNTNAITTRTKTINYSSAMTGVPQLVFGMKSYRGTDKLYETNFEIQSVFITQSQFRVQVTVYGATNMYLLQVQYFAVDPSYPYHMNTFMDVAFEYGSTLTNITSSSASTTTFTQVINYSTQAVGKPFTNFTNPMNYNHIIYYITSLVVVSNSSASFKLDITYSILNSTTYSWTATVYHYGTVTKLHLCQLVYNDYDIKPSDQFILINYNWIDDGSGNNYVFQQPWEDNMICGLTSFGTPFGNCALDYIWDYNNWLPGQAQYITLDKSQPSANSSATCGENYAKTTLFYVMSWKCPTSYYYFNLTNYMCQNACTSYYYYNTTAYSCTPCYYSCYNCTSPDTINACSQCQSGLQRTLVNNTCICSNGYFDDGFEPACKVCAAVDPNSLTCNYTIDPAQNTTFYQNIFNQTTWPTDILPNFTSITCVTAYFVNSSNLCEACSQYCTACTNYTTCTTCNSSLVAILYTDGFCYLCNLASCTSCNADNYCVACSGVLVAFQGVCMTCVQACQCQGYYLPIISGTCSTHCGDGIIAGLEQCDDGNTNDHDGCSSTCQSEVCNVSCLCDGWTHPWDSSNSSCTSICGDGLVRGNQQCDDGNTVSHDGCSSICTSEPCDASCLCDGWIYPWLGSACSTLCGDGLTRGMQECDDGNTKDHDGCSSTCQLQPCSISCLCDGWYYPWFTSNNSCTTVCGDGYVRGIEQCDDGNLNNFDGCDSTCHLQPPILITSKMSQYPALVVFALGFRIVGLQALNVYQSFQLMLDSADIKSFRISFNIHGYTDDHNFPLPIPSSDNILMNFNFMYFIIIGLFVIGVNFEFYNMFMIKDNKVMDSNQKKNRINPHQDSQMSDANSEHGEDFAVHYKGTNHLKVSESRMNPLDQTQYTIKDEPVQAFWPCIIFRQVFFDLMVNLLSVFAYSIVNQIKQLSMSSFGNAQTILVLITTIVIFALICILFAFKKLSFGQSFLKFHKGQVLEYWILLIGEKIIFAAILGSKSFWNLEVILVIKFILITYYFCTRIYFENIQKIRSVVTHSLHFSLIFAVIINEHILKRYGLVSKLPVLFMEYIYLTILIVVFLICVVFYIRQFMQHFEADCRKIEDFDMEAIQDSKANPVFDIKNLDKMQDSGFNLNMKNTSIMDDIKTKKNIKSSALGLSITPQIGTTVPKRKLNHNDYTSGSQTSIMNFGSNNIKKNQSHLRSQRGSNMMSVMQMEEENQIDEIDFKNHKKTESLDQNFEKAINDDQINIQFKNSSDHDNLPTGFKKYGNKFVQKHKKWLEKHENFLSTDGQLDNYETGKQSENRLGPIFETDDDRNPTRKDSRQMTFHNKQNHHPAGQSENQKRGGKGNRNKKHGYKKDYDTVSINLQ